MLFPLSLPPHQANSSSSSSCLDITSFSYNIYSVSIYCVPTIIYWVARSFSKFGGNSDEEKKILHCSGG